LAKTNSSKTFDVSLEDLKIGVPVVVSVGFLTGTTIEIELISITDENMNKITKATPKGIGNTGWSAGNVPNYTNVELAVRAVRPSGADIQKLEYRVDVNGKDKKILRAHSLTMTVLNWTVVSKKLSIVNAKAAKNKPAKTEFNFHLQINIGGWNQSSFIGYLNFELDINGRVRTSWSI